jgi:hypothetical protein
MLDYIESNFNIDMVAYSLISEIIDMFYNDIEKVIEILNNCRIDLTIKELKENNIIE